MDAPNLFILDQLDYISVNTNADLLQVLREGRRASDLRPHSCTYVRFARDVCKELQKNFPNYWRRLPCANALVQTMARQPASDASLQVLLLSQHVIDGCSGDEFFINYFEALATEVCNHMLAQNMHYIVLELDDGDGVTFQAGKLEEQAGDEICYDTTGDNVEHEKITSFYDQSPSYTCAVKSQLDPTFHISHDADATFAEFFQRPVRIASYTWAVGSSLSQFIYPWYAFMSDSRVSNRLNNFRMLSAKLHVRVQIAGNAFYYGRALVSYKPQTEGWDNAVSGDSFTTTRGLLGTVDLVAASQRPHIFLDPATSQGGEMILPFFHDSNGLDLVVNSVADAQELGELWFQSFGPLRHANAGTGPLTVTVFAWMTEVVLSTPTDSNFGGLSPQSGLEEQAGDEYGVGPVSKTANIVAAVAGKLVNVPSIRPYAMATQMAAQGAANLATFFGMSRPADISSVQTRRVSVIGDLASTNREDSLMRLSLDAKHELTIDPRTTGLADVDELALDYICAKESYIVTAPWEVSDTPGTVLFSTQVRPEMFNFYDPGGGNPVEYHMAPCCWASVPFRYWRGKMKYRFQIVASGYHKGKVRVTWDPVGSGTEPDYNTCYNRIVDLAEERDFVVEVGWGQPDPYLITSSDNSGEWSSTKWSLTTIMPPDTINANGVLSIFVQNELVAPNTPTPISINVFASMVEPEFASPYGIKLSHFTWFGDATPALLAEEGGLEEQAGNEVEESDANSTKKPSIPSDPQLLEPIVGNDRMPGIECITMGEKVTSFRQLLKRYNLSYYDTYAPFLNVSEISSIVMQRHALPMYRGFSPGAAVLSLGFNPVATTLLNWTLPLYAGWRGSIRWKFIYNPLLISGTFTPYVTRLNGDATYANSQATTSTFTQIGINNGIGQFIGNLFEGSAVTTSNVNPSVEVEIPYYSPVRFMAARRANLTTEGFRGLGYAHRIMARGDGTTPIVISSYVATGEDFTTFFFCGVPRAYFVLSPP